jgi:hypothetical protein
MYIFCYIIPLLQDGSYNLCKSLDVCKSFAVGLLAVQTISVLKRIAAMKGKPAAKVLGVTVLTAPQIFTCNKHASMMKFNTRNDE